MARTTTWTAVARRTHRQRRPSKGSARERAPKADPAARSPGTARTCRRGSRARPAQHPPAGPRPGRGPEPTRALPSRRSSDRPSAPPADRAAGIAPLRAQSLVRASAFRRQRSRSAPQRSRRSLEAPAAGPPRRADRGGRPARGRGGRWPKVGACLDRVPPLGARIGRTERSRMEVGIGLPNAVPGTSGKELTDWARAAESAGFSSLGTIDRIVYGNYEPLMALSAAAAVTERIRLATTVMLGPLRGNATLVAKQILSLDALAGGGRAVLGIAIGGREDDYDVSDIPMSERGAWLDAALPEIRRVWAGDGEDHAKIGPRPGGDGPSLIIGGTAAASYRRVAEYADGWIAPGGGPDEAKKSIDSVAQEWEKQGREGQPRKMALAYYSLGPDGQANADSYLRDYYAWLGDEVAGMIADSAAKD